MNARDFYNTLNPNMVIENMVIENMVIEKSQKRNRNYA